MYARSPRASVSIGVGDVQEVKLNADVLPHGTTISLSAAFILCALIFVYLSFFSYRDLIFVSELASKSSLSAIELGNFTLPKQRESVLLLLLISLSALYFWGYSELRNAVSKPFLLFAAVGALTLLAVFIAPFDSTDVTAYINQGWLQAHYHVNPYNTTVTDIASWTSDSFLKQHGVNSPCIYGPLFALICYLVVTVAHQNYLLMILLFKLLNAACHLAITWMVYSGVRQLSSSARSAQLAAYLYGCSPFMLLHHVANAHNDIVLALFAVLSFFLFIKRKTGFVFLSCLASVGIKYVSVLVLPGMAVLLYRTTSRKVLLVSALFVIPAVALCVYYFAGVDSRHLQLQIGHLWLQNGSLQTVLAEIPDAVPLFSKLSKIALIAVGIAMFRRWLTVDKERLFQTVLYDSILIQCLAMCVFSSRFYPWYLGMVLPLALLLNDNSKLRSFCVTASCFMLFSLLWFGFTNSTLNLIYLFASLVVASLRPFTTDGISDSTRSKTLAPVAREVCKTTSSKFSQ